MTGSLRQLVPDDHILARVDRVLDLSWLRNEVANLYCTDNGRPGMAAGHKSIPSNRKNHRHTRSTAITRQTPPKGSALAG